MSIIKMTKTISTKTTTMRNKKRKLVPLKMGFTATLSQTMNTLPMPVALLTPVAVFLSGFLLARPTTLKFLCSTNTDSVQLAKHPPVRN